MNDSADQLLQQLGQIGSTKDGPESTKPASPGAGTTPQPADEQDPWRILLIDLVYLLNASFQDARYWAGVKQEKDTFKQFVKVLQELDNLALALGWVDGGLPIGPILSRLLLHRHPPHSTSHTRSRALLIAGTL